MTSHDQHRMYKALACNRDSIEEVSDAVAGLQSTDDPSLVPLWEELLARLAYLKAEKDKLGKKK